MTKTEKISVPQTEIQDIGTQNVDLQKINEASKKITANFLAKLLVIVSIGPAYTTKVPDLMMQDQEALAFAVPTTTILFRYGWFQKMYKEYGHYLNNTDELYMLGMAVYMYGSRVKAALDRKQEREKHEQQLTRGTREKGTPEPAYDGRSPGPIPLTGWRTD